MTTITQATPGQKKQVARFLSDVLEKVAIEQLIEELGLDTPGAQRVIEHGDEFAEAVRIATIASLKDLSVSDKYKDEEVRSNYGYLSGYKPKDVIWQSNRLRELFSGVGFHDEKAAQMAVPAGAEGLFVIPTWQSFAKLHSVSTYAEAVQVVLAKLKETRKGKFHNWRENEMSSDNLREGARKAQSVAKIAESQKGYDLVVIPAQFGLMHRGRSVRRAREVLRANEFGLGAFEVGIMLLTHPERLKDYDDLYVDCPGDEFKPSVEREFSRAPFFLVYGDKLVFDARDVGDADGFYGSASAFSPQ